MYKRERTCLEKGLPLQLTRRLAGEEKENETHTHNQRRRKKKEPKKEWTLTHTHTHRQTDRHTTGERRKRGNKNC